MWCSIFYPSPFFQRHFVTFSMVLAFNISGLLKCIVFWDLGGLFYATINGVFSWLFLTSWLLVSRKAANFYILTLYPDTLLNVSVESEKGVREILSLHKSAYHHKFHSRAHLPCFRTSLIFLKTQQPLTHKTQIHYSDVEKEDVG